jgi:hypothetical protein
VGVDYIYLAQDQVKLRAVVNRGQLPITSFLKPIILFLNANIDS